MSIEKVRNYLKKFNLDNKILEFDVSSATVDLAAKALGCSGSRIAKSISLMSDNKPILIVTAGDTKIDNAKFKAEFKIKAKMIPFDKVEEYIGYAAGGVCPFDVNDKADVYLDESLKRFETVFPACGSNNSAIELTIPQLEMLSGFIKWVDVCKII